MPTITGTSGNDTLDGSAGDDLIEGLAGDDTLNGGDGHDSLDGDDGDDTLNGGDGDDHLYGDTGNDSLTGGAGNDSLDGASGADTMAGGTGDDIYLLSGPGDVITELPGEGIDLIQAQISYTLGANQENLYLVSPGAISGTGNELNNQLWITQSDFGASLFGLGGNDTLTGNLRNDILDGGDGADILNGYFGDDTLHGGSGADILDGDDGNDTLNGGDGDDTLIGVRSTWLGAGVLDSDTLNGGDGNDTVDYSEARVGLTVNLTLAGPQITLGGGNDTLTGIENIIGSDFADTIFGNEFANLLDGGDGNDILRAGAGDDWLIGGAGNDNLRGAEGNDVLDGGSGFDVASYFAASAGVTVQLGVAGGQNTIGAGIDTLIGIENLIGSALDDSLHGDGNANVLDGADGDDFLQGGAGDDTLVGGLGTDAANYIFASAGVTVDLSIAAAQDTLGAGVDTLSGIEELFGSQFADTLSGNAGDNRLLGQEGNDTLVGNGGDDTLDGQWGQDQLFGGAGNDRLSDSSFLNNDADLFDGGSGDDEIEASLNDSADGGEGVDRLNLYLGYATQGVTLDLTTLWTGGTATLGSGVLSGFEILGYISGTNYADTITVGTAVPTPEGFAPPPVIGGAGNDILTGGANRDSLNGGDGDDELYGLGGNDGLFGGDGADRIEGGAGDDILTGYLGADLLIGGAGNDLYFYSDGVLPNLDNIVEDAVGGGVDTIEIDPNGVAQVTDSAWAGVRNVEIARLRTLASMTGPEFVLGTEFQDSGIRTVIASADIDASAMTQGLTFDVRSPNLRNLDITGTAGDDLFLVGSETILHNGVQQVELHGGAGSDIIAFGHVQVANDFLLNINGSGFDSIEGFQLLAGAEPVARESADDSAGRADSYVITMADGWVAAGTRFDIDASGLRSSVVIALGADHELGGSGANADLVAPERLTLDASQLTAGRSVSVTGGAVADMIVGSGADDMLAGGDGDDTLTGGPGNDTLDGGNGYDTASYLTAAAGVTVNLTVFGAQDTIGAGMDTLVDIEYLAGSAFGDSLTGNAADNVFTGFAGADSLSGGAGTDTVDYSQETGGGDVYVNLGPGAVFGQSGQIVGPFQGRDTYGAFDTLTSIERVITGAGNDTVLGSTGADYIQTGAGNDFLNGREGADTLVGGTGNDAYAVDQGDTVVELAGEGVDEIRTTEASYSLESLSNVENLTAFSSAGQILTGNGLDNRILGREGADTLSGAAGTDTLFGLAGNDILDGGAGADAMSGGLGDDRFYVDNAGDVITELAGAGDDLAFVLGTYTLAQGSSIETLYALNQASTDPLVLTGNEFGQSLYGNLGDNYLNGGQGNDYLVGSGGNDSLLGGTGNDHLAGGTGNDIYYVDAQGDLVTELAGEGDNDLLVATVSYALGAGASIETMSAEQTSANINLTGNELAQSIYGNAGDNIITGGGGADYLVGGNGNDRYYVDTSDFIAEANGGGDDWIFVADSYILREGNEIETLVAVNQDSLAPVNLTGNEYGQSLYGSQGANSLNGGAGNDYLVGLGGNDFLLGGAGNDNLDGGAGNDIYYVDGGDQLFEASGQGEDIAVAFASFTLNAGAHVETLSAAEGTAAINLTGNELAQTLFGNAGANVLNGGGGNDYLVGGAGNDRFVFTGLPGNDTIADFVSGADKLDLTAFGITQTDVQATTSNGNTSLAVDTNHDGSADFTITLVGAGAPAAGDYLF